MSTLILQHGKVVKSNITLTDIENTAKQTEIFSEYHLVIIIVFSRLLSQNQIVLARNEKQN